MDGSMERSLWLTDSDSLCETHVPKPDFHRVMFSGKRGIDRGYDVANMNTVLRSLRGSVRTMADGSTQAITKARISHK